MSDRLFPALNTLLPVTLIGGFLLLSGGVQAATPTKRPTDETRGEELYERHCVACHGAAAKGHGPATQALVRPVPDLQGKVLVDDPTINILMRGMGAMPSYEQTFDRFDAKRVLQHMAKLEAPANTPPVPTPPLPTQPDSPPAE